MRVFLRHSEPQPILIGPPELKLRSTVLQLETALQPTLVDECLQASARCGCGHVIEPENRFCGGCGVQLRKVFMRFR
jgi:hypothetical protein